ncbi:MAG: hypothetical protein R3C52_08300 [Hyphomonadaceae bacterium]
MIRYSTTALALVLAVSAAACSAGGASLAPASVEVAQTADDFRLVDQNRDSWRLRYFTDAPAIVLVSHVLGDSVSTASAKAVADLQTAYADKGVEFVMINSSPGVTREQVAEEARTKGYENVRVLVDEQQLVGEGLGVTRGGEAFVVNPKTWSVVYHGPLDDRFIENGSKTAKVQPVRDALEALTTGGEVEFASYEAGGGAIDFPARGEDHAAISYVNDVAPILIDKCASCHTDGGIAPFAMTSYEIVKGFSPMIRETIRTDRMPPFFADSHTGNWKHDASLSGDQIKTLVHWIEAGAPRGEGEDPLPDAVKPAPEWPLGKPDLVLTLPKFDVPAAGVVDYQYPAVANPLTQTRWLRASTIIPGSRTTVHHVLSGYMKDMPKGGAPAIQTAWRGSMGSYTPGAEAQVLPENSGVELPAGGAIGFQMHYTTSGKAEADATRIGLYFYDKPPEFIKRSTVIADASFALEPGKADQREIAYMTVPHDMQLYTVYPHAHYRGVQASLEAYYPDGSRELILDLPRYDFNWQRDYDFVEPKTIPAGTRMVARFTYDNSKRNLANPDPTKRVTWGDQTFEEMFYMRMNYRWLEETRENQVGEKYDAEMMKSLMKGMLDDDLDGKVSPAESLKMANVMKAFGGALPSAVSDEDQSGGAGGVN